MSDALTAEDKLAVARIGLNLKCPYFAAILWAFQPTPMPDMAKTMPGPMGVDQHLRLYYDPDVIAGWKQEVIEGVLRHEIGHVIRNHAARCGERDPLKWNLAGDCEINDDLVAEKIALPDGAATPKLFKLKDGELAETYYEQIKTVTITVGVAAGQCGSVADGQGKNGEAPADGDGKTPPGVSAAEQGLMRMRVAEDVQAHVKSKGRGSVPAWLERWANEHLTAKVDWRRVLAAYIRRAVGDVRGMTDYTYTRPSRRQLPGIVLPAMRQPVPRIAVVVDTSGSMSATELGQALAEIASVLTSVAGQGVTVLSVDAAIHTVQKIFKVEQVRLGGGGGTDMRLGLEAAATLKPRPHVTILVTDSETPWPDAPPHGIPVIVATTTKTGGPTWARTVYVEPGSPK